jgi:hypothetical protein
MHGEGRKSEVEEALLRNSVQSMGTAPRRLADKVMAMVGDRKTAMLLCALFALVFSRTVDQTLYYRLNYSCMRTAMWMRACMTRVYRCVLRVVLIHNHTACGVPSHILARRALQDLCFWRR